MPRGYSGTVRAAPRRRLSTSRSALFYRHRGLEPGGGPSMTDRAYFIAQRDGTAAGLFISEPLITRTENRPGIVLSRRIEDDNGKFAGVVTALIDLEQFYG